MKPRRLNFKRQHLRIMSPDASRCKYALRAKCSSAPDLPRILWLRPGACLRQPGKKDPTPKNDVYQLVAGFCLLSCEAKWSRLCQSHVFSCRWGEHSCMEEYLRNCCSGLCAPNVPKPREYYQLPGGRRFITVCFIKVCANICPYIYTYTNTHMRKRPL